MLWYLSVVSLSLVTSVSALSAPGSNKGTHASSTTTASLSRTPPFSNRVRLDQTLLEGENPSPDFPRTWVPLAAVNHLDPDRPTPLQFMGAKYVCYQDNESQWVVLDDACPHRMAPLSEGRIEREKNAIECAYHGWQFDSSGACKRIPQLEDARLKKATDNPRSCVASYPVVVEKGLLWAWLWSDDPLSVARIPQAHPQVMGKGFADNAYMRDLPYGWDTLLENLVDPAHVPFAHHGLQGTRDDAVPINMTVPGDVSPYGLTVHFEDRTMKRFRKGTGELRAPYVLQYNAIFCDENGNPSESSSPFRLSTVCIPTRPGWSRVIVMTGTDSTDDNDGAVPDGTEKRKSKISLARIIFGLIPTWLFHSLSGRFLDSDLAFLHYQEREARARSPDRISDAYFTPAPADRCIAAMRSWVRKYARAWESKLPLPESPINREDLFDRYVQHVSICKTCQDALEGVKKWKRNSFVLLGVSLVGMRFTPLAAATALGSLLMLPFLGTVEKGITKGGYLHYKSKS